MNRIDHLATIIYKSVRDELGSGLATKKATLNVLLYSLAVAFEDHRLAKRIFPFKKKELAIAGKHQAFEVLAHPNRYGWIRQVRKTVKRKGQKKTLISYVDSRGTVIPNNVLSEILF